MKSPQLFNMSTQDAAVPPGRKEAEPTTTKCPENVPEDVQPVSRVRRFLPQILASTAKNMILVDIGMAVAFPTIVIPAVQNSTGALSLTDEETSWFASIAYICQPLGSILSGPVLEKIGRKKSLILCNLPHVAAWLLFYSADSAAMLHSATALMGLGIGFMEAPILTYIGEICEPEIRGVLSSLASLFFHLGVFCTLLLGTQLDWSTVAAISTSIPMITAITLTQVPETPQWLLSRGRHNDAERSLRWLRGWVTPQAVHNELAEMTAYCVPQEKAGGGDCRGLLNILKELRRPETLRPLLLVCGFFFLQHFSGLTAVRPYLLHVFQEFNVPLEPGWAVVVASSIAIVGTVVCMVAVSWTGKRPLSLASQAGVATSVLLLGVLALHPLEDARWAPQTLFVLLFFTQSVGLNPIPWMLVSEVFPLSTRGVASGMAAAFNYMMAFAASKTYLDLKAVMHLHGVFFFYGSISVVGFVVLYLCLFETEGKTLESIEEHYKLVTNRSVLNRFKRRPNAGRSKSVQVTAFSYKNDAYER